jgi:DNA-binding HxlR family transcriptional regulator
MTKIKTCLVLEYYYFLGKKWTYPILFHMKQNKEYSFDDFIFISNRKISRSILLNFLNCAIKLSLIIKIKKKYKLTKLGIDLKKEFLKVKSILLEYNYKINDECSTKSLISKNREYSLR